MSAWDIYTYESEGDPAWASPSTIPLSLDDQLPPDLASQVYAWADTPRCAAVLRNRDLAKICPIGGDAGMHGLPIYRFQERPCLYATLAGVIVGVTEKDRKWDYLLDDGTQILDVSIHARSFPPSLARHASILASTSAHTLDSAAPSKASSLEVGDLVKVTGKIWRKQQRSNIGAIRWRVGLDAQDVLLLNDDPTAEPQHNLLAHKLRQTEYKEPFRIPQQHTSLVKIRLPSHPAVPDVTTFPDEHIRLQRKFDGALRSLRTNQRFQIVRREDNEEFARHLRLKSETPAAEGRSMPLSKRPTSPTPYASVPLIGFKRERGSSIEDYRPPQRQREAYVPGETHRAAEGVHLIPDRATSRGSRSRSPAVCQSETVPDDRSRSTSTDVDSVRRASSVTPSTGADSQTRQLRDQTKLRDSQCTQSLFRIHVQKYLMDSCTRDAAAGRSQSADGADQPPSFTIDYLIGIETLYVLADRVVGLMLRKRERALAKRRGSELPPSSGEPRSAKVRRLFEWCIRQLLQDGYLVIAGESLRPHWPFDGSLAPAEPDLADVGYSQGAQTDSLAFSALSGEGDVEAYQVVTPALILQALLPILSRSGTRHTPADVRIVDVEETARQLRRRDDRWRYIMVESVREALGLWGQGR